MFFYSREFSLSVVKYVILVMPLVLFSLMPAAILMVNYSLLFDFALLALLLGLMRLHPTLLILILLPMSLSTIQLGNYLYTGQLIDVYTLMTFTATNQDEISGFTSLVVNEHPVLVSFFIFGLIISIAGVCFANMLSGRLITLVAISVMTLYFSLYHIKHGNFQFVT